MARTTSQEKSRGNEHEEESGREKSQECASFISLTFYCSGPGQGDPSCKRHPLQETRILPES